MKFTYKNDAELQKMTAEERDTYGTEKREFEKNQIKEQALEASKSLIEDLKKELATKEADKSKANTEEVTALKQEIEELKSFTKNIDKSLEDLGKQKPDNIVGVNKKIGAIFQDNHKALEAGELEAEGRAKELGAKMSIETKAFDSLNVHSVNTIADSVYPANGTVSAVGDTYRTVYAQILGIFNVPRVYSRIMDTVDVRPLISDTIIAFTKTITSGFAITPEGAEKPVSKIALTSESAQANPVASLFYTTLHMRRFYPSLVNDFVMTFNQLLNEEIPNHVMTVVRANATAFTPIASLTYASPGDFEAIVAVTTSLEKLGYMPNSISLSPVAYAKLITATDTTGAYKLQNGSSIILVGDVVKIGSLDLIISKDAELGDDEFLIGDAFEAVKVGLDTEVFYFETDGTTDNQNAVGTAPATGLARNIRTHELAQFVAVLMPAGAKGALIRDTFANVKTLITTA